MNAFLFNTTLDRSVDLADAMTVLIMWHWLKEWILDELLTGTEFIRGVLFSMAIGSASLVLMASAIAPFMPAPYRATGYALVAALIAHLAYMTWRWRVRAARPPVKYAVCVRRTGDPGTDDWEIWRDFTNLRGPGAANAALTECRTQWPDYLFFAQRIGAKTRSNKP